MNGSWDAYLASPADFARADNIVTNLAKEKESLRSRSSNALPYLRLLLVLDSILHATCSQYRSLKAGKPLYESKSL